MTSLSRIKKIAFAKHFARIILGVASIYAGISHITFARKEFRAQVPKWVPMNKDSVVLISGYVEITLGLCLIFMYKHPQLAGKIVALFFVLVFPGNIAQYANRHDAFGLDTDRSRLVRLFFQPLLVMWALWSTGVWASSNKKPISD